MGRPKKKPEYDSEKIMEQFTNCIAEAYMFGAGGGSANSLRQISEQFNITLMKTRKILITAGVYHTELSEQVISLRENGKNIPEIMQETGLSRSSVHSYLPYTKMIDEPQMIYNIQEDSLSKTSDIKKTEKILSDNLAGYRDIRIYLIEKIIKTPNESERYIRIVDIAYYRSLLKLAIDTRDEQLLKATYSNLKELSGVTINERIEYCQYFFPYMVFPLRCIRKIKTAIDTLRETL